MPCKMIEYQKKYIYGSEVTGKGIVRWFLDKYWTWRLSHMNEGQIIDLYYTLSDKKGDGMELWQND